MKFQIIECGKRKRKKEGGGGGNNSWSSVFKRSRVEDCWIRVEKRKSGGGGGNVGRQKARETHIRRNEGIELFSRTGQT